MSEKYFASHSRQDIDDKFNVFVSTKQILPDLVITKKDKSKSSRRNSLEGNLKKSSAGKSSQMVS